MLPAENDCSPAKCTFNSSSLALLLLIARAPNIMKLQSFRETTECRNIHKNITRPSSVKYKVVGIRYGYRYCIFIST